ncbi:MAG: dicarboxylate/amino acid:cation symporter [Planctomycetes bacterium]|nr:dicarboxylate/amino acid:cation symporter [Planctomycetota bacterium]
MTTIATKRRIPLHTKILIGLVIGAVAGLVANFAASKSPASAEAITFVAVNVAEPIGKVFLRLVIMVVVPLVFSALTLGVMELGDVRRLGRVGLRTLGFTLILSLTSVAIGIGLVTLIKPGASLSPAQQQQLSERFAAQADVSTGKAEKSKTVKDTLLDLLPENPLQEMVGAVDGTSPGNGMLAVMVFSLIVGIALTMTPDRTRPLVQVLEGVFDVSMTIIGFAMRLAPFAVACLLFSVTSQMGLDILLVLLRFVFTVLLGIGLQMFVVYPLLLVLAARLKPVKFFRDVSEAIFTAFGTSSSNATLPTSLRVAKEELKLKPEVSQFVLTVGATANQNGTALFEGVVVLFLAQVFGVELTMMQQVTVVLMAVLAGVGTAGVPGGSIPLIIIVLKTVGVPPQGIALVLGVDRLLDMCRTTLNVTGDLVLAACVSRTEERSEKAIPERALG